MASHMNPTVNEHRREAYTPFSFRLPTVSLTLELSHGDTRVDADIVFERVGTEDVPLVLDGRDLQLNDITLDGYRLSTLDYSIDSEHLIIHHPPKNGRLKTSVSIHPQNNTSLLGLFSSEGDLLTQCEAEGFRKITYFADRPDVLSVYTVKLIANQLDFPTLLSNGNLLEHGNVNAEQHYAIWHDPFPKPSYLFAVVAGQFTCIEEKIVQNQYIKILQFYIKPHDALKIQFAIESLKAAIAWDWTQFHLPLDLERFMVVATANFNAGAMENKGLNIFNIKYIIADEGIAIDDDFDSVEAIVAHEYFHNWTGNRVTCRSWFELTLKEGLTVFREQAFSAHQAIQHCTQSTEITMIQAAQRISVVENLRSEQFLEDAGPMAHAIRPESYENISNFYTSTIYEKGAEIIRMYHTLLGETGFNQGLAHYLQQHDGCAVTCEDFLNAMAQTNRIDLTQFSRWYDQVGTPRIDIKGLYNSTQKRYTLTIKQCSADAQALHIPLKLGLIAKFSTDEIKIGQDLPLYLNNQITHNQQASGDGCVLNLTQAEQTFAFDHIPCDVVPSLNRSFSAPIVVHYDYNQNDLMLLMQQDTDYFNRWDAAQRLWCELIFQYLDKPQNVWSSAHLHTVGHILHQPNLHPALKAKLLSAPDFNTLLLNMKHRQRIEPLALYNASEEVQNQLADALESDWHSIYQKLAKKTPRLRKEAASDRVLKNLCLTYITRARWVNDDDHATALALLQYQTASNMTDCMAAFDLIIEENNTHSRQIIGDFYAQYATESLVIDKWLSSLAARTGLSHKQTIKYFKKLLKHPAYKPMTPNRVHALVFSFCNYNPYHFHQISGTGYQLWAEQVIQLDASDPQMAAELARSLEHWADFAEPYRQHMLAAIQYILIQPNLSRTLQEVLYKFSLLKIE